MPYPRHIRNCQFIVYKELRHIVNAISPTARKRPDKLKRQNSAEEDSKVETGPENGLFWLRRLDWYSNISTILNIYIYIYIYIYTIKIRLQLHE